jgi:hypothetical protein
MASMDIAAATVAAEDMAEVTVVAATVVAAATDKRNRSDCRNGAQAAPFPFEVIVLKSSGHARHFSMKSAHFGTSACAPQGMIGTLDVEFFGEPSMMRSENTM